MTLFSISLLKDRLYGHEWMDFHGMQKYNFFFCYICWHIVTTKTVKVFKSWKLLTDTIVEIILWKQFALSNAYFLCYRWPAMVEMDPDCRSHLECNSVCGLFDTDVAVRLWFLYRLKQAVINHVVLTLQTHYHVVFFDDKVSRAWIRLANLRSFTGIDKMGPVSTHFLFINMLDLNIVLRLQHEHKHHLIFYTHANVKVLCLEYFPQLA